MLKKFQTDSADLPSPTRTQLNFTVAIDFTASNGRTAFHHFACRKQNHISITSVTFSPPHLCYCTSSQSHTINTLYTLEAGA